jgi:hypothetical protein
MDFNLARRKDTHAGYIKIAVTSSLRHINTPSVQQIKFTHTSSSVLWLMMEFRFPSTDDCMLIPVILMFLDFPTILNLWCF